MPAPLHGHSFTFPERDQASRYATDLLARLGAGVVRPDPTSYGWRPISDPTAEWARSGAMSLSGERDGPPARAPAAIATCARGASRAISALSARLGTMVDIDGAALLGERAAIAGLSRRGRRAPGGHAQLVRAADGWFALGLPRPDDRALLPAWLESDDVEHGSAATAWASIDHLAPHHQTDELVARARLLGLPAAAVPPAAPTALRREPWVLVPGGPRPSIADRPLVIDLSALWAGPLVGNVLTLAGARVVKVEDPGRPDSARRGAPAFFDLLHANQESIALDLRSSSGREALRRLLARADVVIESSRPRALEQMGLGPAESRARNPQVIWVSITGYGYVGEGRNWVALGDDAAVAGGLVVPLPNGAPGFCGDAIADPLTGLHAVVAALACLVGGLGAHLDVAMRDVAAHVAAVRAPIGPAAPHARCGEPNGWTVDTFEGPVQVARPRARRPRGRAPALGAHTARVLAELESAVAAPG